MPEEGEAALFSRYYSRPPQAADLYRSLVQAAKIRRTSGTDGERDKLCIDWLRINRGVTKAGGKAGGGKIASANEPSLMIKTGDLAGRSASGDPTGLVKSAASSLPFEKKVEHLFLAAAARQPTPRERQAAAELLKLGGDNPDTALDDLWWCC